MRARGRVLIVAGSDSGGGAGLQADIKTVTTLGGHAATAVTAVTVQDTLGVHGVHPIPPDIVAAQMRVVLADIGADVIKIGMLHDAAIANAVADVIEEMAKGVMLVLDPVMIAKGGASLLDAAARAVLLERLIPRATLVTPNVPELAQLTSRPVDSVEQMAEAACALFDRGAGAVLAKGGHLDGEVITDILLTEVEETHFTARRIHSRHTHGTGCTLASAVAAGLARGMTLIGSVVRARHYLLEAIATAPGLGAGHGPLNHGPQEKG